MARHKPLTREDDAHDDYSFDNGLARLCREHGEARAEQEARETFIEEADSGHCSRLDGEGGGRTCEETAAGSFDWDHLCAWCEWRQERKQGADDGRKMEGWSE